MLIISSHNTVTKKSTQLLCFVSPSLTLPQKNSRDLRLLVFFPPVTFWRAWEQLHLYIFNGLLLCMWTEAEQWRRLAHCRASLSRNQKSCAWGRAAVSGHALTYLEFLASHGPVIWVSHSLSRHGPIIDFHVARVISVRLRKQHNGLIHRVTCRVFGDALLLGPISL